MNSALTIQKYLALNKGRYSRKIVHLPQIKSNVSITMHPETADTDVPHYHESTHFSFLVNGNAVDKRTNAEAEKASGELMFFHAGEIHQTIYKGFPTKSINVELENDFFRSNSIIESDIKSSIEQNLNAKLIVLKIYKELITNDEYSDNSIEMLLLHLLCKNNEQKLARPNWLKKVLELLNDNWNDEISLDELAIASGVHPKTISKYFPKYFACTLGEYRRQIKIAKSLSLIKSSNLSLTEIAYQCGFYDQSHFTATFKHLTGFRPNEYKRS